MALGIKRAVRHCNLVVSVVLAAAATLHAIGADEAPPVPAVIVKTMTFDQLVRPGGSTTSLLHVECTATNDSAAQRIPQQTVEYGETKRSPAKPMAPRRRAIRAESDEPDFYIAGVLPTAFGGGMSSRLFQEISGKRGLVYPIHSAGHSDPCGGLFGIYAWHRRRGGGRTAPGTML